MDCAFCKAPRITVSARPKDLAGPCHPINWTISLQVKICPSALYLSLHGSHWLVLLSVVQSLPRDDEKSLLPVLHLHFATVLTLSYPVRALVFAFALVFIGCTSSAAFAFEVFNLHSPLHGLQASLRAHCVQLDPTLALKVNHNSQKVMLMKWVIDTALKFGAHLCSGNAYWEPRLHQTFISVTARNRWLLLITDPLRPVLVLEKYETLHCPSDENRCVTIDFYT